MYLNLIIIVLPMFDLALQPAELREGFLADLNPESPGFPHTLGELADKLKSWKNKLQTELEAAMPTSLRLEEECRALQVTERVT